MSTNDGKGAGAFSSDVLFHLAKLVCVYVLPVRLRLHLGWTPDTTSWFPEDQDVILTLYVGLDDEDSFKSFAQTVSDAWPCQAVEIDNKRPGFEILNDMLKAEPYSSICAVPGAS